VVEPNMLIGRTAVDLLTQMLQRGERGIPEYPLSQLIDGKWHAGTTIAPSNRKTKAVTNSPARPRRTAHH